MTFGCLEDGRYKVRRREGGVGDGVEGVEGRLKGGKGVKGLRKKKREKVG